MTTLRKISLILTLVMLIAISICQYVLVEDASKELLDIISRTENDPSLMRINELTSCWEKHYSVLSCAFEHCTLKDISRDIYSLSALYESNSDNFYSGLNETKTGIENLREMQKITLGNLF